MAREAVFETECKGLKLLKRGKVRDLYRTTEKDGSFAYTFFKATGVKSR